MSEEVLKAVNHLKYSKSPDTDGIHPKVLKDVKKDVADSCSR